MDFRTLLFSRIIFLLPLSRCDIPGIPTWAQDLARCAPGSPPNSVVRGLLNRNRTSLFARSDTDNGQRSALLSRPLLSRRPKRLGYADTVDGGVKKWPFLGRFEFAELQNWFPKKHMISNVGTLIAPDLVLTARHVIDNIEPAYQKTVTKIYFGSSNRWSVSLTDTSRTISEINFFPDPLVDLAILKLTNPVNCAPNFKIAALAPLAKGKLDDVYECRSASWGKDHTGQCPQSLKMGSFHLYNQKHEYEICARGVDKTLTNVGDSGMPLMCKEPKSENWLQYGVFSFDYWAGDYKVSCFISVPYCYDWIINVIKQYDDQTDIDDFREKCPSPKSFDS